MFPTLSNTFDTAGRCNYCSNAMASLRQLPNSPFWIACFSLPDGTRTQRSTKVPVAGVRQTDVKSFARFLADAFGGEVTISSKALLNGSMNAREARKLAARIAGRFEDTANEARQGRLVEGQARRVIADIFAIANTDRLPSSTTSDFFDSWLKRKELEAGEKTRIRYGVVVKQFLEFLGDKSALDVSHLTSKEITRFRDSMAKRSSANTINLAVKILRAALNQARRDGLVDHNEADRVTLLKRTGRSKRRPFTLDELRSVLAVADDEWRGRNRACERQS